MSLILVVEDDADIAALIAHYLEKAGHRVDRVTSGTDVLPRLRKTPADLVILDLMLPGIDGLLVCQAMRADPSIAGIPIIMLTARGEESDRVSGLELGADDYVTKPFSPKELSARVTDTWVRGQQVLENCAIVGTATGRFLRRGTVGG